jgi:hypothetical protein
MRGAMTFVTLSSRYLDPTIAIAWSYLLALRFELSSGRFLRESCVKDREGDRTISGKVNACLAWLLYKTSR